MSTKKKQAKKTKKTKQAKKTKKTTKTTRPSAALTIDDYNRAQSDVHAAVCTALAKHLTAGLPGAQAKIWHRGPVWFLDDNPIAGYWVRKQGVQLLFWSGQSFDDPALLAEGKFKAAHVHYASAADIDAAQLRRWLKKAKVVQWDYKNIVQRRGVLEKIGSW